VKVRLGVELMMRVPAAPLSLTRRELVRSYPQKLDAANAAIDNRRFGGWWRRPFDSLMLAPGRLYSGPEYVTGTVHAETRRRGENE